MRHDRRHREAIKAAADAHGVGAHVPPHQPVPSGGGGREVGVLHHLVNAVARGAPDDHVQACFPTC